MKQTVSSPKAVIKKPVVGRTITKRELVRAISREKSAAANQVRSIVQAFLDKVVETLACGNRLEFREFGIFEIVRRKQRTGRNPKKSSVSIVIPSKNVVKFTPGKRMRKVVEREMSL